MASNLERLQQKLQNAKEELTKANAIMSEVRSNIQKEIDTLTELGVTIPKKEDYEDEIAWYDAIEAAVKQFISDKESENAEREKEIEAVIEKWEG
jgi:chromosome segregation ATPase